MTRSRGQDKKYRKALQTTNTGPPTSFQEARSGWQTVPSIEEIHPVWSGRHLSQVDYGKNGAGKGFLAGPNEIALTSFLVKGLRFVSGQERVSELPRLRCR